MKLYERLPDSVTADGKKYRLDLDFRNVLRMIEILSRDDLIPAAREYLALKCVMKYWESGRGKCPPPQNTIKRNVNGWRRPRRRVLWK